jgi:hypothetical protein
MECLAMLGETGVFANSDYPASIRRFVTMLVLSQPYDEAFKEHLVGLVKEIAENAANHERSTTVSAGRCGSDDCRVRRKALRYCRKIRDDARQRCGKEEFDSFNQLYASDNPIVTITWEYSGGKNRVMFKFSV